MQEKFQNKLRQPTFVLRMGFALAMVLSLIGGAVSPVFADTVGAPVITPLSVVPGAYVYVKISNLPTDTDYTVQEGAAGTHGYAGGVVSHFNSGGGGTEYFLFETHALVRSDPSVDVRIDDNAGSVAFATFANTQKLIQKSQGSVGIPVTGSASAGSALNTIQVLSVEQGGVVQVEIYNMPENVEFTVSMGMAGQKKSLVFVSHVTETTTNNAVVSTFEIPTDLRFANSIDLHVDAPGYSYFVNFSNTSTPTPVP